MKIMFLFFCMIVIFDSHASELKCSSNGTDVYYVNGVLTSKNKNKEDVDEIKILFDGKNSKLDSGPVLRKDGSNAVQFIGIHNPSFGLINDSAELFAQAYYIKTGNNSNARAIYNAIKNTPESTLQDRSKYDPKGYYSMLNFFGMGNDINYQTLKRIVDESEKEATKRSLASVDKLLIENNIVTHNISTYIANSQYAKSKILFVAHSQGNAVVRAGIKERSQYPDREITEYMKKFMGVYHVASPVSPLEYPYKSKNTRVLEDSVIQGFSVLPGFPLQVAPVTHTILSRTNSDISGHYFYETYISPYVQARSIGTEEASVQMSENFVNTLSDLATELEDNCDAPKIRITNEALGFDTDISNIFNFPGYTSRSQKIKLKVEDLNDTDVIKTTEFDWTTTSLDNYPLVNLTENNTEVDLPIPFSGDYTLQVMATDKNGKVSYQAITIKVPNKAPLIISSSMDCSTGIVTAMITDDSAAGSVFFSNCPYVTEQINFCLNPRGSWSMPTTDTFAVRFGSEEMLTLGSFGSVYAEITDQTQATVTTTSVNSCFVFGQ